MEKHAVIIACLDTLDEVVAVAGLLSPGAKEISVKIFATSVTDQSSEKENGHIHAANGKLYVTCGESSVVEIKELQPAGKKRMSAAEYLRGARLEGAVFE